MQIGVISDIHDNLWALEEILPGLQDCDALLCLGDLCAPFTLGLIGAGFRNPIHVVWGNNDGDRLLLTRSADQAGNITLHGEIAELELDGRRICMTHYPQVARALARSGNYDLVCHGHSHVRSSARVDNTLLLNPGEVMGRFGVCSYAIYDTDRGDAQIIEV
jgi:putative phosphoesterase